MIFSGSVRKAKTLARGAAMWVSRRTKSASFIGNLPGDGHAGRVQPAENIGWRQRLFRSNCVGRALIFCFDAFSSREPASTSLENALTAADDNGLRQPHD